MGAAPRISNSELTSILFILLLLVGPGAIAGKPVHELAPPKVVGEMLAGITLAWSCRQRVIWLQCCQKLQAIWQRLSAARLTSGPYVVVPIDSAFAR